MPLFTEIMFLYLENPKKSIGKPLELIGIKSHWIQGQCSNSISI